MFPGANYYFADWRCSGRSWSSMEGLRRYLTMSLKRTTFSMKILQVCAIEG